MKRNTAGQKIGCQMNSAADGSAFVAAVTVYVTGDGGAQAVGSVAGGLCVHEGNGYHTYGPTASETDFDLIAFTFVGVAALPSTVQVKTNYPQTGDSYPTVLAMGPSIPLIKAKTDNLPVDPAQQGTLTTVSTNVTAIKTRTDNLPEGFKKNTAFNNFCFFMTDSGDHVTGKTGLTVQATRSVDGAAFATCANSVTEISAGVYKINLAAADMNGDFIVLKFIASGADATVLGIKTEE